MTSTPWDAQGEAQLDAVGPATPQPAYDIPRPGGDNQQAMVPGPASAPPPWVASVPAPAPRAGPGRPDGLRLTAAVVTAIGAILIVWACALPDLYLPAGNSRTSFSIFNSGAAGDLWFAVEPVGVAVIGVAAAVIVMLANRSARLRLLATGLLFGFGIQTVLLFAGYEFYVRSPDHAGPGAAIGILGGILLLVAGLIAAASRPASTVDP